MSTHCIPQIMCLAESAVIWAPSVLSPALALVSPFLSYLLTSSRVFTETKGWASSDDWLLSMDAYFFSECWALGAVHWTFVSAHAWPGKCAFTLGHLGVHLYLLQLLTGSSPLVLCPCWGPWLIKLLHPRYFLLFLISTAVSCVLFAQHGKEKAIICIKIKTYFLILIVLKIEVV